MSDWQEWKDHPVRSGIALAFILAYTVFVSWLIYSIFQGKA